MKLNTTEIEGKVVKISLEGKLDAVTSPDLEAQLPVILGKAKDGVIFDFSNLDYISSAGLRVLLMALKTVKALSKTMAIFGLSAPVMEVFQISGFLSVFEMFNTEQQAFAYASGADDE